MPSAGFEPATPATKRPQTYALDRVVTGIGAILEYRKKMISHFGMIERDRLQELIMKYKPTSTSIRGRPWKGS
jgi:hypothetical protein